jgi:hypothetical protein
LPVSACAASTTRGASIASDRGAYQVVVVEGDPTNADKGDNAWTVEVRDASNTARSDVSLHALPYMPDHGHGAPTPPVVEALGQGRYRVRALDFVMPGRWTVTLTIDDGRASDRAVVTACVEG